MLKMSKFSDQKRKTFVLFGFKIFNLMLFLLFLLFAFFIMKIDPSFTSCYLGLCSWKFFVYGSNNFEVMLMITAFTVHTYIITTFHILKEGTNRERERERQNCGRQESLPIGDQEVST